MIKDFTFHNPTRIHFGRTALDHLADELGAFGPTVLLVYGKGSIKKSGLYDRVLAILEAAGKIVVEHPGIKSNPTYAQLLAGARLARENEADLILALGGGSTIDCAKAIAVSAWCEEDPWQRYWVRREPLDNRVIPVGSILTMAGTGSEFNGTAVITNEDTMIKAGCKMPEMFPKFSILNPEFTFTVPHGQMVSGIFDAMSHLFEQYFSGEDDNTTDYLIEGLLDSLITASRAALKDPENYEARSNIMWCASLALNGLTGLSKDQDWEPHKIEHQIGAYTDCPHGAGLAVISPAYYRHVAPYGLPKFVRFARRVWGVDTTGMSMEEAAEAGIAKLADFIVELGLPTTLRELGTTREMLPLIADSTTLVGGYRKFTRDDVMQVLEACY